MYLNCTIVKINKSCNCRQLIDLLSKERLLIKERRCHFILPGVNLLKC